MSNPIPKRVHELSPLEQDDKHKTTPRMSSECKVRFMPKRITELSPLKSSEDEDEEGDVDCSPFRGDNKENLNESFICTSSLLSPITEVSDNSPYDATAKDKQNSTSPVAAPPASQADKPKPTISIFNQILQKSKASAAKSTPGPNNFNFNAVTPAAGERKNSPFEERMLQYNSDGNSGKTSNSDECSAATTIDIAKKVETVTKVMEQGHLLKETPLKTFQVPATNRVLSTHRSIISSQRRRPALESEFRSQKVLFTTPTAVSRPTIALMSNIGMDDSLNCYKSPSTTFLHDVDALIRKEAIRQGNPITINKSIPTDIKVNDLKSTNPVDISTNHNNTSELIAESIELTKDDASTNTKIENEKEVLKINGKEFIIEKKIGHGGSGNVFLARHKESQLECAIKVVNLSTDPMMVEGYIKEVKILAALQDKVNVIRLYEYALIASEKILYVVMEKGDTDLRKILQQCTTSLPLYTLMTYWHQMLQAVHFIHKNGVIHSDLKPENFLMVNGRLKLIDFGISSKMAVDSTSIIKHTQVGTFNYISPEALMDTSTGNSPVAVKKQPKIKISPKTDVWSLGCILYLLLYKRTPFGHIKNAFAKMQIIVDPNTKIEYPDLPNYYPNMLLEMVHLCLKHNPKERAAVADLLAYPFNMVIPIDK